MTRLFKILTDHFRPLFLLVLCLAATPAHADLKDYPFKLNYRAEEGGQVVVTQNNGPAAILAIVKLDNSVNIVADHPSPIVVVVKPKESKTVAMVHAADAGKGYRLSTSCAFSIGDPDAIQDSSALYRLPFMDGQATTIGQVLGGRITTHTGPDSRYAVDFVVPIGTPVLAARKGVVVDVDQGYTEGGNDPKYKANHVLILHEDGTLATYAHFSANRVTVSLGQKVEAGTLIGYSGNTGYSTGPHLHFAVLTNTRTSDGTAKYVSVPVTFVNDAPDQVIKFTQDEELVVNYSGKLPPGKSPADAGRTAAGLQPPAEQVNP